MEEYNEVMEVPCKICLVKGICIGKLKQGISVLDLACEILDDYIDEWVAKRQMIEGLDLVYEELRSDTNQEK